MKDMTLGDLYLASTGRTVDVSGQSAAKVDGLHGRAKLFSVRSAEWEMTIAHKRWNNGNQDIELHDRGTAPQRFDRFLSTGRLGLNCVPLDSDIFVELRQAQMGDNNHPTLRKVELDQLSEGAGCDIKAILTKMGAKVGPRSAIIEDTGRRRSYCCARFPRKSTNVAVVAYVLTRIAPFYYEVRAESPQ